MNTIVQLGTIGGIVVANGINIGTNQWVAGWRISLGLAAVPGSILLLGDYVPCLMVSLLHPNMQAAYKLPPV